MDIPIKHRISLPRRLFLFLGGLSLLYPLIRFVNHRVPRKPEIIVVSGPLRPGGFLAEKDFFIFSTDNSIWAVSRTCTHLGCRLNFKEKEGVLECPCHQSRFTTRGNIINGPALKQLQTHFVEQKGEPPSFVVTI